MISIYNGHTVQSADREIIGAIKNGNRDVFEQVFHTCYGDLCRYAATIVKDMDEAEDIVQAMFLKIWEKRAELTIQHTIRAYLFRAVYHQCLNAREHKVIRLKYQEYGMQQGMHTSQAPEVFPDELSQSIRAAINELPEQCRNIFVMSRYEELRYAEIAQRLNISVNTIENQISKALRILRLKLKDSIF
ncbi:RNA polymerase sigma-70 factor [Ohtaekwangia sp.]|uniref:RNA polymerase sigma-70 factor n=1 Tax=Ohtaekwangia sp. TaxID=2066019 RepID=UPI002F9405C4